MGSDLPYSSVLVSGKLTVAIRELSISDDERKLELQIDGRVRGEVCLRPWCLPRLAIGHEELLLWGGTRAYAIGLAGAPLRRFDFEDEIHRAYRLPSFWCLICETSVVLWRSEEGVSLSECLHDEILLQAWWDEERLIVEDLQNRRFEVEFDDANLQVTMRRLASAARQP